MYAFVNEFWCHETNHVDKLYKPITLLVLNEKGYPAMKASIDFSAVVIQKLLDTAKGKSKGEVGNHLIDLLSRDNESSAYN